jgi:5-methyltetrahydrofolate--homocysteine methyltransferase
VEAGAEVIETNTFGAHRFKLGPHGLEAQVRKINAEGARPGRGGGGGRALVAGSIGPVGKPLEPYGNLTFDDAVAAYRDQVEGLVEGGVDLFFIETMPSLDQARAAVTAVKAVSALPFSVAMTFNEEGTTFYGDKPEDIVRGARGLGRGGGGGELQPGPAAHAGDRAAAWPRW